MDAISFLCFEQSIPNPDKDLRRSMHNMLECAMRDLL
jgi:hypothetical protein